MPALAAGSARDEQVDQAGLAQQRQFGHRGGAGTVALDGVARQFGGDRPGDGAPVGQLIGAGVAGPGAAGDGIGAHGCFLSTAEGQCSTAAGLARATTGPAAKASTNRASTPKENGP